MPHKSGSTPVPSRVVVCGLGNWGKNHARHFHELGALGGICDARPEVLKQYASVYRDAVMYGSFDQALKDDAVHALVLAVPTPQHYAFARRALEAGKHVFVEKPLALSVREAEHLCRIADKKHVRLMVGHLLLYHPALLKLKEVIDAGELGDLFYLYTQRLNLGQVRKDENAMWSLAPHDISVLLHLFGPKPKSVSAHGSSYIQRARGIEDVIFMNVTYADGRSAHIHLSWLDPHKVRKITLVGSEKMVVFDDMEQVDKLRMYDKGVDVPKSMNDSKLASSMILRVGEVRTLFVPNVEPLKAECHHFLECIEKGLTPRSDGWNGVAVLRILEAATRSLKSGGRNIRL